MVPHMLSRCRNGEMEGHLISGRLLAGITVIPFFVPPRALHVGDLGSHAKQEVLTHCFCEGELVAIDNTNNYFIILHSMIPV